MSARLNQIQKQWLLLFSIIFAGEVIFSLPFHLARFFRPSFLASFELTNTELGDIFAFYGVIAMLAYFPGGYLADRFSPKRLMSVALVATALGGVYMGSFPAKENLTWLFAYWGLTTILFFWSAMIKLTRDIASHNDQGKAFGLLDGGRGFVAASLATLAVYLLGIYFPDNIATMTGEQRQQAMLVVIYYYSFLTFLAGLIIWLVIPDKSVDAHPELTKSQASFTPLTKSIVWYQALIVLSAYCGFKGLDYFGLYLVEVFNYNELESSELIAYSSYIRPVAAILAGVLADRFLPSRVLQASFLIAMISYVGFSLFSASTPFALLITNIVFCFIVVFSLRAVYFALIEQTQIARNQTGISVGIISVIGFTPDIFFAPLAGRLLDNPDAAVGFQQLFIVLLVIAIVGVLATTLLVKQLAKKRE